MRLLRVGLLFLLCLTWAADLRAESAAPACAECHTVDMPSHSVHEGLECVDCHKGTEETPHEAPEPAQCKGCHAEAQDSYERGTHGQAALGEDPDAPECWDCHEIHGIRTSEDPGSMVYPKNLVETCARCHSDPKVVHKHPFTVKAPVESYKKSAHYKALMEKDSKDAPSCVSCHGNHELKRAGDPGSGIHWTNVSATCGKCHTGIMAIYEKSVHGSAAAAGARQAPVCTDCHGEHEIRGPKDPKSSVYPDHISKTTCVWCHESVRVMQKYDLPGGRLSTYLDSYHGLAHQAGSKVVANCASCHGVHNILPSEDLQSTIHPSNLPRTCGKCHPGFGQNTTLGPIHVDPSQEEGNLVVYYIRWFYIFLILFIISGMTLHNGLDFARNFRTGRLSDGKDYLRFTLTERLQHATMALTFMILAYSGFALAFPNAFWASPFSFFGGGEEGRRLVHRIAAGAMVAVCVYHMGYLALTARGRGQFLAMLPRFKDVLDLFRMIGFYIGKNGRRPDFARFSYIEKMEYWSLVWGSVLMAATGFVLWFTDISLRYAPKWALDAITVIHYYEACLAVLAIVVWHLYWVIFNPKVYPMSLVWLTGGMSEEAMEEEHPLELEKIRLDRKDGGGAD